MKAIWSGLMMICLVLVFSFFGPACLWGQDADQQQPEEEYYENEQGDPQENLANEYDEYNDQQEEVEGDVQDQQEEYNQDDQAPRERGFRQGRDDYGRGLDMPPRRGPDRWRQWQRGDRRGQRGRFRGDYQEETAEPFYEDQEGQWDDEDNVDARRGRRGGQERRGRGQRGGQEEGWSRYARNNPEEILTFLEKHEPEKAQSLRALQQENPSEFNQNMALIGRLYGPVMRQMEYDPDMGQLSLNKIKLRLEIEKTVQQIQLAKEEAATKNDAQKLRMLVSDLFEIVVAQEELQVNQWQERLAQWQAESAVAAGQDQDPALPASRPRPDFPERLQRRGQGGPPSDYGRGGGRGGRGGGRRGPGSGRGEQFEKRLEDHKEMIATWRKGKQEIVEAHMTEVLKTSKPFPWN